MNDLENSLGDISVDGQCYRVAKNSEVGRHIVVTKPLRKGDIIFKDTPLVTGPSRESDPCCVACYKLLGINSQDLFKYTCCKHFSPFTFFKDFDSEHLNE